MDAEGRIGLIRRWGRRYPWFIETGTADGHTTASVAHDFERLVTIELDYKRYLHVATNRLMAYPNILPLHGDSGVVLREVVYWQTQPALFWLDAHYSGGARGAQDTPIVNELQIIATSKHSNQILIDDARLFGTDPAYPEMEWVEGYAEANEYVFSTQYDIIRLSKDSR